MTASCLQLTALVQTASDIRVLMDALLDAQLLEVNFTKEGYECTVQMWLTQGKPA